MEGTTANGRGERRTAGPTGADDWDYRTLKRFDALRARDHSKPPCDELIALRAEMKVRLWTEAKQAWDKTTQIEVSGPLRITKIRPMDIMAGPINQLTTGRTDFVLPAEYRRQCFACNYKVWHGTPEERSTKVLMNSDWKKMDCIFPSVQEYHDQLERREKQSLQRVLKTKPQPTPFQKYQQRQTSLRTARVAAKESSLPARRQTRPTSWELVERSITSKSATGKAKANAKASEPLCAKHQAMADKEQKEQKPQPTAKPRRRRQPSPETDFLKPIPAHYLQRSALRNQDLFILDVIDSPHQPPRDTDSQSGWL